MGQICIQTCFNFLLYPNKACIVCSVKVLTSVISVLILRPYVCFFAMYGVSAFSLLLRVLIIVDYFSNF